MYLKQCEADERMFDYLDQTMMAHEELLNDVQLLISSVSTVSGTCGNKIANISGDDWVINTQFIHQGGAVMSSPITQAQSPTALLSPYTRVLRLDFQ